MQIPEEYYGDIVEAEIGVYCPTHGFIARGVNHVRAWHNSLVPVYDHTGRRSDDYGSPIDLAQKHHVSVEAMPIEDCDSDCAFFTVLVYRVGNTLMEGQIGDVEIHRYQIGAIA